MLRHHVIPSLALKQGDQNQDVGNLQMALWRGGYLPGSGIDGIYGPQTAAAVRLFEQRHGLYADGTADSSTRQMVYDRHAPVAIDECRTVLTMGDKGESVARLQRQLDFNDYYLGETGPQHNGVDGQFGRHTQNAVLGFEQVHGLRQDGAADPLMRSALNAHHHVDDDAPWVG